MASSQEVIRSYGKREVSTSQTNASATDDKIDQLAARLFRIYNTHFYDRSIEVTQTCSQRPWRFANWLDREIKENSFQGLFHHYSSRVRIDESFFRTSDPNIYRSARSRKLFLDKTSRCSAIGKEGYTTVFERFLVREYLSYMIRKMRFKHIKVPRKYLVGDANSIKQEKKKGCPIPLVKGLKLYSEYIEDDDKIKHISLDLVVEILQFCVVTNYCDIQVRLKDRSNFHLRGDSIYVIDTDLKAISNEVEITKKIDRFSVLIREEDKKSFEELLRTYQRFYSRRSVS